ncbi:MAG: cell division protein FtsL [Gammaproteobacteria bacterium]
MASSIRTSINPAVGSKRIGLRVATFGVLALVLVVSAVAQVAAQHERRLKFASLRALERERDVLEQRWGQLELEQSAWVTHDRIEKQARARLGLVRPSVERIVLVQP